MTNGTPADSGLGCYLMACAFAVVAVVLAWWLP